MYITLNSHRGCSRRLWQLNRQPQIPRTLHPVSLSLVSWTLVLWTLVSPNHTCPRLDPAEASLCCVMSLSYPFARPRHTSRNIFFEASSLLTRYA